MVLNRTLYVRNIISFFYKQYLFIYLFIYFFAQISILAYIYRKSPNRQLWRYCDLIHGIFVLSGMYGKKRPIATTLWYQISIPQAFIFQQSPWLVVLQKKKKKKNLVRRGFIMLIWSSSISDWDSKGPIRMTNLRFSLWPFQVIKMKCLNI